MENFYNFKDVESFVWMRKNLEAIFFNVLKFKHIKILKVCSGKSTQSQNQIVSWGQYLQNNEEV